MSLRDRLKPYFDGPKTWVIRKIKTDEVLKKDIEHHFSGSEITDLEEMVYVLWYGDEQTRCHRDNKRLFMSIGKGYRLGCAANCACLKEHASKKISSQYTSKTDEEKAKTVATRKNTVKEKYGVDNVMKSDVGKESLKKTNLERFGHEHAAKNETVKKKAKKTLQDKYGIGGNQIVS